MAFCINDAENMKDTIKNPKDVNSVQAYTEGRQS